MRAASVAVVLGLMVWVVVVRPGPIDIQAMGTLAGVLIVLLGFVKPGGTNNPSAGAK